MDTDTIAYAPKRAADIIGLSRPYVYLLIKRGQLDARKIGGRTIITRESLQRFIESAPPLVTA